MLTKCPECGGVVSDKAQTCPHCGAPVACAVLPAAKLSAEETETSRTQVDPEAAQEAGRTEPISAIVDATPPTANPHECPGLDTAYRKAGSASTSECEPGPATSGGGEAHLASSTGRPASTVSAPPDRPNQAAKTSTLPYRNAGGFCIAYGIFNAVISPAIAVSNVRSEIGSGSIAASPGLWGEVVGTIWGLALAMGLVFAGMGVAILRSRRPTARRGLVWCAILLTLVLWLVLAVRSTSSGQGGSTFRLGVPDILFISALVGSLTVKKPHGGPVQPTGSVVEGPTQARPDEDAIWRYRVNGHVGHVLLSTHEIRSRIESGKLPRHVEVWAEGADKWRPASDYAAFVGTGPRRQNE